MSFDFRVEKSPSLSSFGIVSIVKRSDFIFKIYNKCIFTVNDQADHGFPVSIFGSHSTVRRLLD